MNPRRARFRTRLTGPFLVAVCPLAACVLLGGCTPVAGHPDPPSSPAVSTSSIPSTASTARAQHTVDAFVAAARRGDTRATANLVSDRDQLFAGRTAVWADNLAGIDWSTLTWTVQPRQAPLSAARRAILGPDAWAQTVTVRWSLPGEPRRAEHEVWLTFVDQPTEADGPTEGDDPTEGTTRVTRLAGDGDGPTAGQSTPIWLQQETRVRRAGQVLVLSAADDAAAWSAQAGAARAAVAARAGTADRDPDGPLVVEVPQSRTVFERVLGVSPGSYAAVAAAAWPMGPDTGTAPLHVIVNPAATRQLSALGRDVLLTHEAVHVATRSPGSPAPTWLVEGYADEIAYAAHPAGSAPAERAVRSAVRARGVPADWPREEDLAPSARDLDLGYDLAWTAARSISDAYGDHGLNRFYAAVDAGDSLNEAAAVIGSTESQLRTRWRADLERLAGS